MHSYEIYGSQDYNPLVGQGRRHGKFSGFNFLFPLDIYGYLFRLCPRSALGAGTLFFVL